MLEIADLRAGPRASEPNSIITADRLRHAVGGLTWRDDFCAIRVMASGWNACAVAVACSDVCIHPGAVSKLPLKAAGALRGHSRRRSPLRQRPLFCERSAEIGHALRTQEDGAAQGVCSRRGSGDRAPREKSQHGKDNVAEPSRRHGLSAPFRHRLTARDVGDQNKAMRLGNPSLQRPSHLQTQPHCPDRHRDGGCPPGVPPGAAPDCCIDRARSNSVIVASTHDFTESCGSQRTATVELPLRKKKAAPPRRIPSRPWWSPIPRRMSSRSRSLRGRKSHAPRRRGRSGRGRGTG